MHAAAGRGRGRVASQFILLVDVVGQPRVFATADIVYEQTFGHQAVVGVGSLTPLGFNAIEVIGGVVKSVGGNPDERVERAMESRCWKDGWYFVRLGE